MLSYFRFAFFSILLMPLFSHAQTFAPVRDAQAIDILTRTVNATGGSLVLASVHDLAEVGDITFYWGDGITGPVTIRYLGGNHFRMEADVPGEKNTWIMREGSGSKTDSDRAVPISSENLANLGNLTYPIGHVVAALADPSTAISFIGVEQRDTRSVYRLRLQGRLGVVSSQALGSSVAKDLIIDALTFDILSVEDTPFRTRKVGGGASDAAPRQINFGDFRVVNGARIPFSIEIILLGQKTLSIQLHQATFNSNLSDEDFKE